MTELRVIGIDPGPIPGMVLLVFDDEYGLRKHDVLQCSAGDAGVVFAGLAVGSRPATLVQIEAFVVRRRATRSSTAAAGAVTRNLITELGQLWIATLPGRCLGSAWLERNASRVKPWATDQRLDAAGLLKATKGLRHARDAARHALFAAVHDGGIPDPLSKEWRAA